MYSEPEGKDATEEDIAVSDDETFTAEVEGTTKEIKYGGRTEQVTKTTLDQYMQKLAEFHLVDSCVTPLLPLPEKRTSNNYNGS